MEKDNNTSEISCQSIESQALSSKHFWNDEQWWQGVLSNLLGSSLGVLLTIGIPYYFSILHQKEMQQKIVTITVYNIDRNIRKLDKVRIDAEEKAKTMDWVMAHYPDRLDELSTDTIMSLFNATKMKRLDVIENTTQNIFSSNLEVWENINDAQLMRNISDMFAQIEHFNNLSNQMYASNVKAGIHFRKHHLKGHPFTRENAHSYLKAFLEEEDIVSSFQEFEETSQVLKEYIPYWKKVNRWNIKRMNLKQKDFDALQLDWLPRRILVEDD